MDDIPTLTEMIAPGKRPTQVHEPAPEVDAQPPHDAFLQFFWNVEVLRQRLYEKFNYKVIRRIENYGDGSACIKLTCPPYGKGEPGSQPHQRTIAVNSTDDVWELEIGLSSLQDALEFFIRKKEMEAVAHQLLSNLTAEQREALRWMKGLK